MQRSSHAFAFVSVLGRSPLVSALVFAALVSVGCRGQVHGGRARLAVESDSGMEGTGGTNMPPAPADPGMGGNGLGEERPPSGAAFEMYRDEIQPLLASECSDCHLGQRFAFASLERAGDAFTDAETESNYRTMVTLISLDQPELSRLLLKPLSESAGGIKHLTSDLFADTDDGTYQKLLEWARLEKEVECPDCGVTAEKAYVAYVEQPEYFWMVDRKPVREDRGIRRDARIMLQPVDPGNGAPQGDAIDFLTDNESGFCADGDCDFGHLSADHEGKRLAFECRVSVHGEAWLDRAWNICVAEIGDDGKAENPRFLLPEDERHYGVSWSRVDPLAVAGSGDPSPYDYHFQRRARNDAHPVFAPNDARVVFASDRPDPRSGIDSVQTYHGTFFLNHIIHTDLEGGGAQTVYRNEGGTADHPFFMPDGKVAFHAWNLDRTDRHLYLRTDIDGMMEQPPLGGRLQGPNAWGKAFVSNNGVVMGISGRRRAEMESYATFTFDHTLGVKDIDPNYADDPAGFHFIPDGILALLPDYPEGYCPSDQNLTPEQAADTKNCSLPYLIMDPAYMPDGRALVTYSPEKTYLAEGERFVIHYTTEGTTEERLAQGRPYFPKKMGIGALDQQGNVVTLFDNRAGFLNRYPTWVGRHAAPRPRALPDNGEVYTSDLHIADVPLWFLFQFDHNGSGSKVSPRETLDQITALRVLRKVAENNTCLRDASYIQMTNINSNGYHPTALGFLDATGFEQYSVPEADGGTAFGDVPVREDRSLHVRVPAGELLLFQGVDERGRVIAQLPRIFALGSGRDIDTSVKRSEYHGQCAACHGKINPNDPDLADARDFARHPAVLTYDTMASAAEPVDLIGDGVTRQELTYLAQMRPVFDDKCVSCHSGESPDGGLSLQAEYSADGNYPVAALEGTFSQYESFMSGRTKVPSYNFSVSYAYAVHKDENKYSSAYSAEASADEPLAALAPWDAGYQNLTRPDSGSLYYLSDFSNITAFGRAKNMPSNASRSYLIEVLAGTDEDNKRDYAGSYDHVGLLTDRELRMFMAVLDVGMPYMARCGDKEVPAGAHQGEPWGDDTAVVQ